ncbi:hypothetical protein [Botrimarina hoheduenensis]|uniref:Uncharacterized protein n=1 Tax=Botrimarina hoheduenensis TaxID=2528000 RepID=A0A5C5VZN9_9BACT|nr:hypothetical protein [Botrimarina hoheduenensis]TWT43385.1 hypothetical protein Pla111_23360 [Botrimarina hoheduenensis]
MLIKTSQPRRRVATNVCLRLPRLLALLTIILCGEAHAVEIDFGSSTDLNGFLRRNEFQWLPILWAPDGGVGG